MLYLILLLEICRKIIAHRQQGHCPWFIRLETEGLNSGLKVMVSARQLLNLPVLGVMIVRLRST